MRGHNNETRTESPWKPDINSPESVKINTVRLTSTLCLRRLSDFKEELFAAGLALSNPQYKSQGILRDKMRFLLIPVFSLLPSTYVRLLRSGLRKQRTLGEMLRGNFWIDDRPSIYQSLLAIKTKSEDFSVQCRRTEAKLANHNQINCTQISSAVHRSARGVPQASHRSSKPSGDAE